MAKLQRQERVVEAVHVTAAILLIAWVWIRGTAAWLIGSPLGVLVLSLAWYGYLRHYGLSKPFLPSELLAWLSAQRYEVKLGIAGGLLTALGFAIAFWTAASTWRRQKELELRLNAQHEIHARFERALRLLNSLESYLHVLIQAISTIPPEATEAEVGQRLVYFNSQAPLFASNRQGI